jgi:hypothetical protein
VNVKDRLAEIKSKNDDGMFVITSKNDVDYLPENICSKLATTSTTLNIDIVELLDIMYGGIKLYGHVPTMDEELSLLDEDIDDMVYLPNDKLVELLEYCRSTECNVLCKNCFDKLIKLYKEEN